MAQKPISGLLTVFNMLVVASALDEGDVMSVVKVLNIAAGDVLDGFVAS